MTITKQPPKSDEKPKFTGRKLVRLAPGASRNLIESKVKNASIKVASFKDYGSDEKNYNKAFEEADGILFEELGIMVINPAKQEGIRMLTINENQTFLYEEPERYVYAITPEEESVIHTAINYVDDHISTWGLKAVNVLNSQYTGQGIKIAILDTGLNMHHPDYAERTIMTRSFIRNETIDDHNGHGTHTTGTAAGRKDRNGRRYGVAVNSSIYHGKVLSNAGSGTDSGIIAGIEWALTNGCKVISMSLGAAAGPNDSYSRIYNDLAGTALERGTLIIAAAGNESDRRQGYIAPVGHPANCPNIMAVAALNNKLDVAYFSCGEVNPNGGQIDIAAPGVNVYSSWMAPELYATISGTSMATPCVAGVAALYWEANPGASARKIWQLLEQNAKVLSLPKSDVGAGLVQAP